MGALRRYTHEQLRATFDGSSSTGGAGYRDEAHGGHPEGGYGAGGAHYGGANAARFSSVRAEPGTYYG